MIERVLKKIGGHWAKRQVDGDKYICLDNLLAGGSCLIYSFGISKDWTFEDMLDSAGLKMRNLSREKHGIFHKWRRGSEAILENYV